MLREQIEQIERQAEEMFGVHLPWMTNWSYRAKDLEELVAEQLRQYRSPEQLLEAFERMEYTRCLTGRITDARDAQAALNDERADLALQHVRLAVELRWWEGRDTRATSGGSAADNSSSLPARSAPTGSPIRGHNTAAPALQDELRRVDELLSQAEETYGSLSRQTDGLTETLKQHQRGPQPPPDWRLDGDDLIIPVDYTLHTVGASQLYQLDTNVTLRVRLHDTRLHDIESSDITALRTYALAHVTGSDYYENRTVLHFSDGRHAVVAGSDAALLRPRRRR